MVASTLEARSLRRHPLHTAGRLARLARIGFKHPRSRLHVLEFDRGYDSDGLVASLQAAHGMPLLLSDQVSVLGGSVSPTLGTMRPTVVGGRLLQPRRTDDGGVRIDSGIRSAAAPHRLWRTHPGLPAATHSIRPSLFSQS